jgi:hypothetical protein
VGLGFLLLPRRARKLFRQQRTLHHEMSFSWSDGGSEWRRGSSVTDTPWADYHRWMETPETFLLYVNDILFHFVPKRALDSVQADDLRATLAAQGPARL